MVQELLTQITAGKKVYFHYRHLTATWSAPLSHLVNQELHGELRISGIRCFTETAELSLPRTRDRNLICSFFILQLGSMISVTESYEFQEFFVALRKLPSSRCPSRAIAVELVVALTCSWVE